MNWKKAFIQRSPSVPIGCSVIKCFDSFKNIYPSESDNNETEHTDTTTWSEEVGCVEFINCYTEDFNQIREKLINAESKTKIKSIDSNCYNCPIIPRKLLEEYIAADCLIPTRDVHKLVNEFISVGLLWQVYLANTFLITIVLRIPRAWFISMLVVRKSVKDFGNIKKNLICEIIAKLATLFNNDVAIYAKKRIPLSGSSLALSICNVKNQTIIQLENKLLEILVPTISDIRLRKNISALLYRSQVLCIAGSEIHITHPRFGFITCELNKINSRSFKNNELKIPRTWVTNYR